MIRLGYGTQVSVIGTEHTLLSAVVPNTCAFVVDTVDMQAADAIELRVWYTVLPGGVSRQAYGPPEGGDYAGVQAVPIKLCVPVPSDVEVHFTLKQVAGAPRSFPWKVLAL